MKKILLAVLGAALLCAIFVLGQGLFQAEAEPSFVVFSQPGTHGPQQGVAEYLGDITVSSAQTHLQNLKIEGNLYLAPEDEGTIRLTNVDVEGAIVMLAAEETSIYLQDVAAPELTISQAESPVTITTQGSTRIPLLQTRGQAIVQEEEAASGFSELYLNGGSAVEFTGAAVTLTIAGDDAELLLSSGEIAELIVQEGLLRTRIEIGAAGLVKLLDLAAAAKVTGEGTIEEANLHVSNVELELEPLKVTGLQPLTPANTEEDETEEEKAPIIIYRINNVTLKPGKAALVSVETTPSEQRKLTATSSSSKIVTAAVYQDAIQLRAVAAGTARITVTASHPDCSDASVTFTVTVPIVQAASPTVSPGSGEVAAGTPLTLATATPGAAIYYTTDGSQPSTNSMRYSASSKPVVSEGGLTLKAIAVSQSLAASQAVTFRFTTPPPVQLPDEEPPGGEEPPTVEEPSDEEDLPPVDDPPEGEEPPPDELEEPPVSEETGQAET
ncbi:MAG TPA: chitobiase/beta-hexosaminidase C-terminal domain-containing protein [Oscillospiraceae bacterium]|nr:chitobiase/beta-hexosaminidase C-terminal domain-containing protein [Oscillospiraceae bacterium]